MIKYIKTSFKCIKNIIVEIFLQQQISPFPAFLFLALFQPSSNRNCLCWYHIYLSHAAA